MKILNRFGHGVSNECIREAETVIAETAVTAKNNVLSGLLAPRMPLSIAFDNTDINEETLTGGGTFHGTSGCIVQQNYNNQNEMNNDKFITPRTKQRAFKSCESDITPYFLGKRVSPCLVPSPELSHLAKDEEWLKSVDKNFVFVLQHCPSTIEISVPSADKCTPSWTGFNHKISSTVCQKANVQQIPVTSHSPTEISVVYLMLSQADEIRVNLNLDFIVVVSDLAIYCKMVEVLTKEIKKGYLSKVVVCMGGFHIIMNFASVVGAKFGIAGLRDLMIESGIVAAGSVDAVLNCKHYNRCIRSIKLVYEAMSRMKILAFVAWLEQDSSRDILFTQDDQNKDELTELLDNIRTNPSSELMEELLASSSFAEIKELWQKFREDLHGPMFEFWDSFCYMCDVLLGLIRSFREANWNLHLSCIRKIIPFMFAYEHQNYARHLPYYWTQMSQLPNSNPEAHEYLADCGFSAQLSADNKFGKVPLDYIVEKTNRAMKVKVVLSSSVEMLVLLKDGSYHNMSEEDITKVSGAGWHKC